MKYRTVVIDFPWDLKSNLDDENYGFSKKFDYDLMTDQECLDFPINDFADEKCDLFLWVTHTTLPLGMRILEKWGFKYHCMITWDKTKGPVMLGFNRRTEMVLYGYRGGMGIKRSGSMPTLIKEVSKKNSQKPRLFYDCLLKQTTEPRIDIFARRRHEGFEAYGNQVDNTPNLEGYFTIKNFL